MNKEIEIPNKTNKGKNNLGGLKARLGKTVLAASMLTGIGAPVNANSEDESVRQANIELSTPEAAEASAERLKARIKEIGDEPLTFQESTELIPVIADFYVNNINTDLSPEVITENSFVVTGKNTDEDRQFFNDNALFIMFARGFNVDFNQSPIFERMRKDYPDLEIGNQIEASSLAGIYKIQLSKEFLLSNSNLKNIVKDIPNGEDDFYGLATNADKNTFIFLHSNNNSDNPQLVNLNTRDCVQSSPVEAFITSSVHETIHFDSQVSSKEIIENELSDSLKERVEGLMDKESKADKIFKSGFTVLVKKAGEKLNTEEFHGLDEFVAHYITTQMLATNGISTLMLNDRSPQAISNFEVILRRAGISLSDLKEMHSNSKLEDFLIKIAEGSRAQDLETNDDKLRFGFDLFSELFKEEKNWQDKFGEYYEIDLKDYNEKPFSDGLIYDGCGVPLLDTDFAATSASD